MLFVAPELDSREVRVLGQIEGLKKNLLNRFREPRRWFGSLRRMAFARAIQGSNTIEGYTATLDDAAAIGLGQEPLDADTETKLALAGYREAMTFVLQLADEGEFSYSDQLLRSLHFMMTGYDLKNRPGKWRIGTAYVRNEQTGEIAYEGPDADEVPSLVSELIANLNESDGRPALIKAGMAHLNLVMIHPFRDGNGRMARCLQSLVLAREGIIDPVFMSIEEYLGANILDYYKVLGEVGGGHWQPHRDPKGWIRFTLVAHLRQAQTMLRRAKESEILWNKLETLTADLRLRERTLFPLFDAAVGFRVRNATYRAAFEGTPDEVTEQTASRDLRQLVESELLIPRGERRGRFYVASPKLAQEWDAVRKGRDPRDESDPFASGA